MARPTLTPAEEIFGEPVPTPERLLRAAADLFAERGFDGVTLQEVATHAGVTTGAVYGNFGSKEKFLLAAVGWIAETELDQLVSAFRVADDNDPVALLEAWFEGVVDPARGRHRSLLVEAAVAARRTEEARDLMRAQTVERTDKLRRAIDAGRRRGEVAADIDADTARWFLHALAVGIAHVDGLGIDLPAHDDWAVLLRHVFLGLATDLAPEPTDVDLDAEPTRRRTGRRARRAR